VARENPAWGHRRDPGRTGPAGPCDRGVHGAGDPARGGRRSGARRTGPTWREFLAAQAHAIIACDFLVAETAQQARNLVMDLDGRPGTPRFLIHDRDPVFTTACTDVFKAAGLRVITTLPRRSRMNVTCERVIGTLRRELPDRTLILNERHLALVLREYVDHYNGCRPHQSRQQRPPDIETRPTRDVAELRSARRKPAVAGLINEYHYAA
jgi:putative transposase